MGNVLALIHNEEYKDRLKKELKQNVSIAFVDDIESLSDFVNNNETYICILDLDVVSNNREDVCDFILSINSNTRIILLINNDNVMDALDIYNKGYICRVIDKNSFNEIYLAKIINDLIDDITGASEARKEEEKLRLLNDKYIRPMNEMSALLNERLFGYESIDDVLVNTYGFILNYSEKSINTVCDFVDKLIRDYVHTYLISEPDIQNRFEKIENKYNKPEEKKYFMFEHDDLNALADAKYNLLFLINSITLGFDTFYPLYRGKIAIKKADDMIDLNAIYEVRKDPELMDVYSLLIAILNKFLDKFSLNFRYGIKGNIIQFRIMLNNN